MRRICAGALMVAALVGGCAYPSPGDPLDPGRSAGGVGAVGRPVLGLLWKKVVHDRGGDTRPQEFAQPLFVAHKGADMLYVSSLGGQLFALTADRGELRWRTDVGATSAQPLADEGVLYVGTDDGQVIAVDELDGKIKWRYATRGAVQRPPVVWHELVIFSNDADHVYALERETGKWRWTYERETPEEFTVRGHGGVALAGDLVVAGFADGNVAALHAATGDLKWARSLAGESTQFVDVDTTPLVAGGVIYVASAAGGVYALDPAEGKVHWHVPITGAADVVIDGRRLYVAAAELGVHALDLEGHVLWRQGTARAGDPSTPIIDGNYVIVSTSTAGLFVADKRSGALYQGFNPGFGVSAQATIAGDRLFVLSNAGVLYAMSVERF